MKVREVLELSILREPGADTISPRQLQTLRFMDTAQYHIDDVVKFLEVTAGKDDGFSDAVRTSMA
jgi:hypothetical protein